MSYHYFVVCYDSENNSYSVDLDVHYQVFDKGDIDVVEGDSSLKRVTEEYSEVLKDINFQAWQNLKKLLTTYKGEIKL